MLINPLVEIPNQRIDRMRKSLDWLTWITAIILAVFFTLLRLATEQLTSEQKRVTVIGIVLAVLIGAGSQIGLFLSPWAVDWKSTYQKVAALMMIPGAALLVSQLSTDFRELFVASDTDSGNEALGHGIEFAVLMVCLTIYAIQFLRVSLKFLRAPGKQFPPF